MLDFWYSERCNRQIKLLVIIVTCTLIYAASTIAPLGPIFVGASLGIDMLMHLLRSWEQKISPQHPYAAGFRTVIGVIPLVILITLFGYLPEQPLANSPQWRKFALGIQCIGFVAIGLFILSVYENRARRFES